MPRHRRDREEETTEITGTDASVNEAEFGTAGNGLDFYTGDLADGAFQFLEEEPDRAEDIVPLELRGVETSGFDPSEIP